MACANIFQALKVVSESLGKDVHRKALNRSVWLNAVPTGAYPLGKGLTQTTFTIENSMPTNDEIAWQNLNAGNTSNSSSNAYLEQATGGFCDPQWNDVEWGYSEQTYSPERIAVRGPQICQSNLKYQYNVDVFMRAYLEEITKHSKRILENKIQNEYMKKARKVTISGAAGSEALNDVATGTDEFSGATLADTVALLPGHLDQLAIKLIESGATEGDSNGWIELGANGPVFPLIIGMEASNKLLKSDANVRTDYRESSKSNELLARLGADRVTGNFRHIVVTNPPRFVRHGYGGGSADGTYDRVSEHAAGSPTKGTSTVLNPRYTGKDISDGDGVYEAAIALVPSVMKKLVVPSQTPGGLAFSPENYSGDWQFITGDYKNADGCADPLEVYGRHYGQYEMAFEPVFGDHGASLLFKRDNVVA